MRDLLDAAGRPPTPPSARVDASACECDQDIVGAKRSARRRGALPLLGVRPTLGRSPFPSPTAATVIPLCPYLTVSQSATIIKKLFNASHQGRNQPHG